MLEDGVSEKFNRVLKTNQYADSYYTLSPVINTVKLPEDKVILQVFQSGNHFGYIPFEFDQVLIKF